MSAFKHRALSFRTTDVPPPEVGSSIGPISLLNAIEAVMNSIKNGLEMRITWITKTVD